MHLLDVCVCVYKHTEDPVPTLMTSHGHGSQIPLQNPVTVLLIILSPRFVYFVKRFWRSFSSDMIFFVDFTCRHPFFARNSTTSHVLHVHPSPPIEEEKEKGEEEQGISGYLPFVW